MSDNVRPHRWQPTRFPRPWDSPGKSTGAGFHFLLQSTKVKSEIEVAQSCPTLSHLMDCSPPGSSVHGIFQARVLEWVAIAFSERCTTTFKNEWSVFFFKLQSGLRKKILQCWACSKATINWIEALAILMGRACTLELPTSSFSYFDTSFISHWFTVTCISLQTV